MWWEACAPFDFEQVTKALTAHAMDPDVGKFPPMPSDIVRVLHGTKTDRALVAWGKVVDAMQSAGAYRSVAFDDPLIHLAIADLGDWPKLCRTLVDELPFVQKRFCDGYRMHASRPPEPHPARLIGESEAENQRSKLTASQAAMLEEQTVLIGDPLAAKRVIQTGGSTQRHEMTLLADAMPAVKRIGKAA